MTLTLFETVIFRVFSTIFGPWGAPNLLETLILCVFQGSGALEVPPHTSCPKVDFLSKRLVAESYLKIQGGVLCFWVVRPWDAINFA